jgi:hypothetical protein
MMLAHASTLKRFLTPLGLQNKRTKLLLELAFEWQKLVLIGLDSKPPLDRVMHLPGVGDYALDSYAFFVLGDFSHFRSGDKELKKWLLRQVTRQDEGGPIVVFQDGYDWVQPGSKMIEEGW